MITGPQTALALSVGVWTLLSVGCVNRPPIRESGLTLKRTRIEDFHGTYRNFTDAANWRAPDDETRGYRNLWVDLTGHPTDAGHAAQPYVETLSIDAIDANHLRVQALVEGTSRDEYVLKVRPEQDGLVWRVLGIGETLNRILVLSWLAESHSWIGLTTQQELVFMQRNYELEVFPMGFVPQFTQSIRLYPSLPDPRFAASPLGEHGTVDESSSTFPGWVAVAEFPVFPGRLAMDREGAWATRGGVFSAHLQRVEGMEELETRKISSVPRGSILAASDRSLWIATAGLGGGRLRRLSTEDGTETASVAGRFSGAVLFQGGLWALRMNGQLLRMDPLSLREMAVIELADVVGRSRDPSQRRLFATEESLWMVDLSDGSAARLDPASGSPSTILSGSGCHYGDAVMDAQSIWMASSENGAVNRIDCQSGTMEQAFDLSLGCEVVAVGDQHLWVLHTDREEHYASEYRVVSAVDLDTGEVTRTRLQLPRHVRPFQLGFQGGRLWLAGYDGRLRVFAPDLQPGAPDGKLGPP